MYDGLNPRDHQPLIYREQKARLERLIKSSVDYIVSDSPIALSAIYGAHLSQEFCDQATTYFLSCSNVNFVLERNGYFTPFGRAHNLEESKAIDQKIIDYLLTNGVPFTKISSDEDAAQVIFNSVTMGS